MQEIEACFLNYLNENDLYLSQDISINSNNVMEIIKESHANNVKLFQDLDLMFKRKYSNYFQKEKIEYCIGKNILIADPFDGSLRESLSCKSILKDIFKDSRYSLNITKEEFDSILESDDIPAIIENIKLLYY